MDKKSWIYTLNAIAMLLVLAYLGVLSLMLTPPTESEVERRELAARPAFSLESYFGREFTQKFDVFYADTFPGREGFIKVAYAFDEVKGYSGEVKLYKHNIQEEQKPVTPAPVPPSSQNVPAVSPPASGSTAPESQPGSTAPEQTDVQDDGAYLNNNIFIYKNAAYQIFYGDNKTAEDYAKIVSSYAAELPGVNVYAQVIPQPFNFYLPQRYRKLGTSEKDYADHLRAKLTDGAKLIPVYEQLEKNKDEYQYFRTDTHWTARGAYSAYEAFCQTAGFTPLPLEQMEKRQVPGDFLGYLYTITMDKNLAATPDHVEYFIVPGVKEVGAIIDRNGAQTLTKLPSLWAEDRTGGSSYSVFIYGDLPYMRVKTTANTGRSVLLIKDSYGNAFAPYLVSHYDTVHILDERYFPYSVYDLIKEQGIDDVIISNSSYSAAAVSHQRNLSELKKSRSGLPLPDFDTPPAPKPTAPAPELKQPESEQPAQ